MNPITEMLGCRYPVLQGAMSLVSNPELVAAVAEAGGFGVLASAPMDDPATLRAQIESTRKLTTKPFGVNVVGFNPQTMAMAEVVVEMGVGAITSSAGLSGSALSYLKRHAIKVLQVVPSVAHALKAQAAGADAIIAEGSESGGAQGGDGVSTIVLVPLVVDAVELPVIAAGGIADRRGYLAAMALGASGVQMGSRFLASTECVAHADTKDVICRADEQGTALIPVGSFKARVVRTPLVAEYLANPDEAELRRFKKAGEDVFLNGRTDLGFVSGGQVIGMIREVMPVRRIIEDLVEPSL